jgi:gliding motility-associated-like protein
MKLKDHLQILGIFLSVYLLQYQISWAQCPKVNDIRIEGREDSSICVPDLIQLSVDLDYLPSGAEVQWYSSTTPNFNPLLGQGDLLEVEMISGINFPVNCPTVCPSLKLLYTEPCNSLGNSYENEFVVIASGGGFYASNLRLEFDSKTNPSFEAVNKNIEIGSDFCQIQQPNPALISQLRKGACNSSNLIPAGPGDYIPPGAIVIFFLSSDVGNNFNISDYCTADEPIYILQNACTRNRSAFMTNGTCTGVNRFMYQSISLKGCSPCFDELNYDLCGFPDSVSSYVISVDKPLSSNNNGGVISSNNCKIPSKDKFFIPDTTVSLDVFLSDINDPLCGQTIYYKVVLKPNDGICNSVVSKVFPLKVECPLFNIANVSDSVCSGSPLNISLNAPPNAVFSWIVNAPIEVSGLESKQEQTSQIIQTPILDKDEAVEVLYEISIISGSCVSDQETAKIIIVPSIQSEISGNLQLCKGQSTELSVEPTNNYILWSTGEKINKISVNQAGTYSVLIKNNLCSFSDTVIVKEVDQIVPEIIGDSIVCNNGNINLSTLENYDSYLWSNGDTSKGISINNSGLYSVEVSIGDCKGSGEFTIKEFSELPVNAEIKQVTCNQSDDGSIVLEVNVPDNLVIWQDGEIGKVRNNLSTGFYIYTISSSSTCFKTDTITVERTPALLPNIEVVGLGCIDSEIGSVKVLNVENAVLPIQFSFDGSAFSSINEWKDLQKGNYLLSVKDSLGCTIDTNLSIVESIPLAIILADTVFLVFGSNTILKPIINGESGEMTYLWIPAEGLSCSDCLNPIVESLENIEYQFTAINNGGCRDSVKVFVKLEPKLSINIPQIFSPNGDGLNDRLQILSSSENLMILRFSIFNRWGEKIFSNENFKIEDPKAIWDGTISGKPAPTDSYLYEVGYQSSDDSVSNVSGVVILIR